MDAIPNPTPEDDHVPDEQRLAELTGMTRDSARTYMEFHSGMRWLRARHADGSGS